ncbi:uncharacterized protein An07g08780 [Aspergillus niger]|uniref:Contig An07c0300, genomic contig n=2 Tax=Aspergillus niger TaxID=5061 RepID=A2QPA6_ASPNC|nr:uncharacterized protein An07g08780 [Aspergillus niger]CAK39671.1 unnamed protein product [Aspergillus niger]
MKPRQAMDSCTYLSGLYGHTLEKPTHEGSHRGYCSVFFFASTLVRWR